ncbi:MAG: hypothetical protein KGL34_03930 [Gammaproteobacteria bacterium]|nr:hypothetical protein [Gammaproteobacteria bacterium]
MSGPAARRRRRLAAAALLASVLPRLMAFAAGSPSPPEARIEARSATYRLVGVLNGEVLDLHLSRRLDNAPVADAVVGATFRGRTMSAIASVDGGYRLDSPELALPGPTAIAFEVTVAGRSERLDGIMRRPQAASGAENNGGVRQFGWWVLNFSVGFGFLWLIARRRKHGGD